MSLVAEPLKEPREGKIGWWENIKVLANVAVDILAVVVTIAFVLGMFLVGVYAFVRYVKWAWLG